MKNKHPVWLWRQFSWLVGDDHAYRLVWIVRLYCALVRKRLPLHAKPPGVHP